MRQFNNLPKAFYTEKEKRNEAKKLQTELDLPSIPKLSQSFIKSLYIYKTGDLCGIVLEEKIFNKTDFPSSNAQDLGNYFEYKATGQLPRNEVVPEAKMLKNGNVATDYARMDKQVQNFEFAMKHLNFEIEKTGFVFTNPKYSGIADIIALDNNIKSKVKNKKRIIIDLKTSGLINDKYTDFGWHEDTMSEKWDLNIQAIHYKMLAKWEWGIEDIPFYFFVFSTKNDWEYKIYEIKVNDSTKRQHYENLQNVKVYMNEEMEQGWQPRPKYENCRTCMLNMECSHAENFAQVKPIYI